MWLTVFSFEFNGYQMYIRTKVRITSSCFCFGSSSLVYWGRDTRRPPVAGAELTDVGTSPGAPCVRRWCRAVAPCVCPYVVVMGSGPMWLDQNFGLDVSRIISLRPANAGGRSLSATTLLSSRTHFYSSVSESLLLLRWTLSTDHFALVQK